MKRFLRQFRYGEKGFTLIELLIVIAILGILAAVLVPNVGKFMGKGTIEAANVEAKAVQIAVLAAMVDAGTSSLPADGKVGPGDACSVPLPVPSYLTGNIEAEYTIGADGSITGATAGGKWKDLCWWTSDGRWHDEAPTP